MRVIMSFLVVLFWALLCAPLTAADALIIEKPAWPGAQAQSPRIATGQSGLDFTLVPASGSEGPTLALLGLARVPSRYAATYGERIAGALLVVAFDLRSGAMYQGSAEPRNPSPLSKVLNAQPSSTAEEAGLVDTYFNLDLRAQLGLPATSAKYAVLVWLDDMISAVQIAKMPGEASTERASKTESGTIPGMHFSAAPWPEGVREDIVLRAEGSRVHGATSPRANLGVLRIVALDFRTRAFTSVVLALPKRDNAFDFDLSVLGGFDPSSTGIQKSFVLAGWGATWSQPLVVDRTRQP